ncbi:MAG: hypothetical protein IKM20_08540 [Erysipelotrichales bacterium]|nr:hypothetical protein [Erysipelotrichales bacterium]
MKFTKSLFLNIIIVVLIVVSFGAGSYIKEQEYRNSRIQRCGTLITFALDKVENGDISNQDTMEALISNIYAAYEYCDDPVLANQLHDLWNVLIFEGDDYAAVEDILLIELKSVLEAIRTNE